MILLRLQTGRRRVAASAVFDAATVAAHQMMVIVAGAALEMRRVASRADLAHQPGCDAGRQDIIGRLPRQGAEALACSRMNLLGGGMRVLIQPVEYGMARCSRLQAACTQQIGDGLAFFTHPADSFKQYVDYVKILK